MATWGNALVSADGRTVTMMGGEGGCGHLVNLVADETSIEVGIAARRLTDQAEACTDEIRFRVVVAKLRAPLGSRRLLDAETRQPIQFFDGRRLASVGYLPRGYAPGVDSPAGIVNAGPPDQALSLAVGQQRSWRREFDGPPGMAPLHLTQVAAEHVISGASVERRPLVVRGREAVVGEQLAVPVVRWIEWSEGGYSFEVGTSEVMAGQRLLSLAELRQVAESLRLAPEPEHA